MAARTILIVDDDEDLRSNLVEQLQDQTPFHIVVADNVAAAFERVEQMLACQIWMGVKR